MAERSPIEIVGIGPEAFGEIWPIFRAVVATGDTYAYPSEWGVEEAKAAWFGPGTRGFVARVGGRIVGCYVLKPNQPGRGAHVANAAFMVAPEAQGAGVGLAMGRHALTQAARDGYLGMQFNMVVANNTAAVRLWKRLGFAVVGEVPRAFQAADGHLIPVLIMYRDLDREETGSPLPEGTVPTVEELP